MFGESYSESPRLPSPWDSRLGTPTGNTDPRSPPLSKIATVTSHSLVPEEDLSGHIEYKLRLPAHPSADRLARLTSQLKWRLLEGGGEAIYELGVCDNGLLLGIDNEELQASLCTLSRMAAGLGAELRIARRVRVTEEGFEELSVEDDPQIPMLEGLYKQRPPIAGIANATAAVITTPGAVDAVVGMSRKQVARRKRLSKKEKRQMKRDQEHAPTLRKTDFASKIWPAQDGGCNPQSMSIDVSTSSATTALCSSTARATNDIDTPLVDDVPLLSHSPSPPSSTSGLDSCRALSRRSTFTQASFVSEEESYTHAAYTLQTVSATEKAVSDDSFTECRVEEQRSPALDEQRMLDLRRHLRRQWKKERQQAKHLDKMRTLQIELERKSRLVPAAPEDSYLDSIACLFAELDVTEESSIATPAQAMENTTQPIEIYFPDKLAHRRGRRGLAFSPTSTPLSEDASSTSLFELPDRLQRAGVVTRENLVRRGVIAKPKGTTNDERYAVECVITTPVQPFGDEEVAYCKTAAISSPSAQEQDEGIVSSKGGPSEKISSGAGTGERPRRDSQRASSPGQLQAFIDFETVWDELEMDL